jgi:serine/threonine protein kinase
MGAVYEVFDHERAERVALKTLLHTDPSSVYRLKHEFRALSGISHPNLVQLYELSSVESRWFFTMELINGSDFIAFARPRVHSMTVARNDPQCAPTLESIAPRPTETASGLQMQRVQHALSQLADALFALHSAGKLHRDIKPSNMLVTPEGRLVLLDFGLVAETGIRQWQLADLPLAGTPAYMSPEQLAGQSVSPASDWYSVGLVLYQALTGEVPHLAEAKHLLDLDRLRHGSELRPPRSLNPDVTDELNDLCMRLLRPDPIQRPSSHEMASVLRSAPATEVTTSSSVSTREFVGREPEIAELAAAFSETLLGRPVIVQVFGSSGIGKTALAQHFVEEHVRDRAIVLRGRCYEQESVPYKALDSLIDELVGYLQTLSSDELTLLIPHDVEAIALLFPVFYNVDAIAAKSRPASVALDPREARRRAVFAFRDLLLRMSDRRPLILCIDDVQWGDVDSGDLLGEVLRLPAPPSHLLLLSCRLEDREESPFLRALFATPQSVATRHIEMGPLPSEQARQLAATLLDQPDAALAASIAREAGGSPFMVRELAGYASRPLDSDARKQGVDIRLKDVLRDRLGELPKDALRLLQMVALGGGPVRESVAREAAGSGIGQSAIALLRNRKLIRSSASRTDTVEVYHDRIREAVVRGIEASERGPNHRSLAEALQASGDADPEMLASQFRAAGDLERATRYAIEAAEHAAQTLAFDRAARLFQLSLELLTPEDTRTQTSRLRLAEALSMLGRAPESAQTYLVAATQAGADEARQLRQKAAGQLLLSGHIDEGLAIVDTVLCDLGLKSPKTRRRALVSLIWARIRLGLRGIRFRRQGDSQFHERALLRVDTCWTVGLYLSSIDPIRGAYFQAYGLLLALRAGDPLRIARSLTVEASYHSTSGRPKLEKALSLLRSARALSDELNHPYLLGLLNLAEGIVGFMAEERWSKCTDLCQRSETVFRENCRGVIWELSNGKFFFLNSLLMRGELAYLATNLPTALKAAKSNGDLFAESFLRLRFLPMVWLAADRSPDDWGDFDELAGRLSTQEFYLQHYWERHAVAQRLLYADDGIGALGVLRALWPALRRSLLMRMQFHRIDALHVRARCLLAAAAKTSRLDAGHKAFLHDATVQALALRREGTVRSTALASLVEASVASLSGHAEEASGRLHSAADGFDASGMALFAAVARYQRGRLLGDERGAQLMAESEPWMNRQGIVRPDRMSNMLAPGLAPLSRR